ncbi:MAG TPA: hypothetical protein VFW62_09575, partial [bacterium]|nr:hypothetical protein [bacterium]
MYEKNYRSDITGKNNVETGWQPESSDLPTQEYLIDEFDGEEELIEDNYEGPEAAPLSLGEVQAHLRSALQEAKARKDETAVATLEGLIGRVNRAAALSPASQQAELSAIMGAATASFQTDLGETALEGAAPEAGETEVLKKDIDELQSKLKDLNDETERENLEDALKDAEKALKSSDLEKAQELYDAAAGDFDEVKGEQDASLKDGQGKIKAMRSEIEDSKLSAPKKTWLLTQLEGIEDQA